MLSLRRKRVKSNSPKHSIIRVISSRFSVIVSSASFPQNILSACLCMLSQYSAMLMLNDWLPVLPPFRSMLDAIVSLYNSLHRVFSMILMGGGRGGTPGLRSDSLSRLRPTAYCVFVSLIRFFPLYSAISKRYAVRVFTVRSG